MAVTIIVFGLFFYFAGIASVEGHPPSVARAMLYTSQEAVSLFRTPDAQTVSLTPIGEVGQILIRLAGPLCFGLALLSLRGRVKR